MDISKILSTKYVNSEWTLDGDNYSSLNWLSDIPKPTEEELESLWAEVKDEIETKATARADARTSALNKLSALGLTQEEIDSL